MFYEVVYLLLQVPVVADSFQAFTGFLLTDCLRGSFSGYDSSPSVIGAMKYGRILLAGAIRFAAGALGSGNTPGQNWEIHFKNCFI